MTWVILFLIMFFSDISFGDKIWASRNQVAEVREVSASGVRTAEGVKGMLDGARGELLRVRRGQVPIFLRKRSRDKTLPALNFLPDPVLIPLYSSIYFSSKSIRSFAHLLLFPLSIINKLENSRNKPTMISLLRTSEILLIMDIFFLWLDKSSYHHWSGGGKYVIWKDVGG